MTSESISYTLLFKLITPSLDQNLNCKIIIWILLYVHSLNEVIDYRHLEECLNSCLVLMSLSIFAILASV